MCTGSSAAPRRLPGGYDPTGTARALRPRDGPYERLRPARRDAVEIVEVLQAVTVRTQKPDVHVEGQRVARIEAHGVDPDTHRVAPTHQPVRRRRAEPREVVVRE